MHHFCHRNMKCKKSGTAIEVRNVFGRTPLDLACAPLATGNKERNMRNKISSYIYIYIYVFALSFAHLCTAFASVYLRDGILAAMSEDALPTCACYVVKAIEDGVSEQCLLEPS